MNISNMHWIYFIPDLSFLYILHVHKLVRLLYKGNIKFNDIYDVFKQKYLKIAKNVLNLKKKFLDIMKLNWIFIKCILKQPNCNRIFSYM